MSRYGARQWAKWKAAGAISGALGVSVRRYDRAFVFINGVRMVELGALEFYEVPEARARGRLVPPKPVVLELEGFLGRREP